MPSSARTAIGIVACAILFAATAWLLDRLAQLQFTAHLRDQAAHALALAASGATPYRWHFNGPDDIVAGRVFGADNIRFNDAGLSVLSTGPEFEIGLPLARKLDLRRFPDLHIDVVVDAPALVQIVARENLDAPQLISTAVALQPGKHASSIDLGRPGWRSDGHAAKPPSAAAMLRLHVTLAPGKEFRLHAATMERVAGAHPIDLARLPHIVDPGNAGDAGTAVLRLPFHAPSQKVDIETIGTNDNVRMPLLVLLPQHGRVEQQIALRNAVFDVLPGAILIPEYAVESSFQQARAEAATSRSDAPGISRWIWLAAYILAIGYCRWHPPRAPRPRAFVEIVLASIVPLWLIPGGLFDGSPDAAQKLLIALSLAYSISLSVHRQWQWNGSMRAWLLAGAVVVLAVALGLAAHRSGEPMRAIGTGHIARYVVWALLQQYLICAVCTERWQVVTGVGAVAVYLGALGFALMHTPNAILMLATFAGGLCWCALYLRERALLPLAVSHAVSALILLALLPADILASAEVSARFFQ
jgi:hypothetical protein